MFDKQNNPREQVLGDLCLATEIDDITFCFQIQSFSLRYQELQ